VPSFDCPESYFFLQIIPLSDIERPLLWC